MDNFDSTKIFLPHKLPTWYKLVNSQILRQRLRLFHHYAHITVAPPYLYISVTVLCSVFIYFQDIFECKTCGLTGTLCCCTECAGYLYVTVLCSVFIYFQDIFECKTCGLTGTLCCCTECARVCHKGHECK